MSKETKLQVTGWVLGVYIQGDKAVLWVRTEDGKVLRLTDRYAPSFYVKPKDSSGIEELAALLRTHPNIILVEQERKQTSLSTGKTDVLQLHDKRR